MLAVLLAATTLAGCAKGETRHEEAAQRHGPTGNPSDFPLYPQSTVTTVVPVTSDQIFAAIRANDPKADLPKNFRGHEIIAETSASMKQLSGWIRSLKAAPPLGLHDVSHSSKSRDDGGVNVVTDAGAQFESKAGDRSVFVFVADPRQIREQLGAAFALIDGYNSVPALVRGPLDDQAKKQMGYSVTEMLDAQSPIGAAIATLKRLQSSDRRAILVIDEARR
jgi:hypothetical protein